MVFDIRSRVQSIKPARTKVCALVGLITLCVCWMTMFSGFMIAEDSYKTQDIDADVDSYLARHGSQAANVLNKMANRTVPEDVIHSKNDETIIKTDQEVNTTEDIEPVLIENVPGDTSTKRDQELEELIKEFMMEEEVERQLGNSEYASLANDTETSSMYYVNDEPVKWEDSLIDITELANESPRLMDKLIGRWRQVRTVGLKEYLKAEGENWLHQKMAAAAVPDFIFTKKSENHYVQTIQVSIFPTEEYAIVLDQWYEYKDHFGRTMKAFATDDGNVVHSIMLDGPVGPQTSVIELINDELYLTTIIDKQNVKAIRILHRV